MSVSDIKVSHLIFTRLRGVAENNGPQTAYRIWRSVEKPTLVLIMPCYSVLHCAHAGNTIHCRNVDASSAVRRRAPVSLNATQRAHHLRLEHREAELLIEQTRGVGGQYVEVALLGAARTPPLQNRCQQQAGYAGAARARHRVQHTDVQRWRKGASQRD